LASGEPSRTYARVGSQQTRAIVSLRAPLCYRKGNFAPSSRSFVWRRKGPIGRMMDQRSDNSDGHTTGNSPQEADASSLPSKWHPLAVW